MNISIILILLLLELYFPYLVYNGLNINPDFFLILIILIGFKYGRLKSTLVGFLIGFIRDFLTQYFLFGFLSFLTTSFGYLIANIRYFRNLNMRYIFLFFSIIMYFYLSYYIQYSGSNIFFLKFSVIKTCLTMISYFILKALFTKSYNYFEKF